MSTPRNSGPVLVHLASGVGNLILATPLLVALNEMGLEVDVRLDADYPAAASLFAGWSAVRSIGSQPPLPITEYGWVLAAVPPFYWWKFAAAYRHVARCVARPPDAQFYEDEQAYYLAFARVLGYPAERRPAPVLPVAPSEKFGVTARTLVLAPGSKTGEMTAKRWPHFPALAARFDDVAIVGTADDLPRRPFPAHCRSFVDRLSLRETAELMASAGVVLGNDCGLAHVAAATGTPVVMLFGPTDPGVLGKLPDNVTILRRGLRCQPCWSQARLNACAGRIDCLTQLGLDDVEQAVRQVLG